MTLPVNSYEYRDGGKYIVVKVPRCVLVFTKSQWIDAIKRGKIWRRHGGESLKPSK